MIGRYGKCSVFNSTSAYACGCAKLALKERHSQILRIVRADQDKVKGRFEPDRLLTLACVKASCLSVVRTFSGYGRPEKIAGEASAICLDGTLYFCAVNGAYPWIEIVSELADVLYPDGGLNSLALELKEALAPESVEEAATALDRYGYPSPPDQSEIIPPAAVTVAPPDTTCPETAVGAEGSSPPSNPNEIPTGESSLPSSGTVEADSVSPPHVPPKAEPNRPTRRLVSYVCPKETDGSSETTGQQEHREKIAQMGVDQVMEFERKHGRTPTDMETIQTHHPGYDIESVDAQGKIRYIEVKTLSGVWSSSNPVQVTPTEFKTAQSLGDDYWLYIVEKVSTENTSIHRIQNPAANIDHYLFDHGWLALSEVTDQPAPVG